MNARYPRFLAVLLSVLLVLGQAILATAQDAPTTSPYTTVSGQALAWAAPWSFVEDDAMQTSDLDLVFLTDGAATVAVSTGDVSPENARGLVIGFIGGDTDLLEIIDQGGVTTTSYWFDQFPLDDEPCGAFSVATSIGPDTAVLAMYISPVASFGDGMASVQQGITLDGEPLFDGVDGMALEAQLGSSAPVDDQPGFRPKDRWIDETYGVTVEWAEGWMSLGVRDENTFMLGSAETMAAVHITAMNRNGTTPDYWASEFSTRPLEVSPGSVVMEPYIGQSNAIGGVLDEGMLVIQEVLFLDDGETIVLVSLGGIYELMPPAINAVRAHVRIDGRTLLDGWETMAPGLEELAAIPTAEVPVMASGLVGEGQYESPQFGVEIAWDTTTWALYEGHGEPAGSDPSTQTDDLHLMWLEEDGVWIEVFIQPSYGASLQELIDYSVSPGVVESVYGPDIEVVATAVDGNRGIIAYRSSTWFDEVLLFEEYTVVNDGHAVVLVVFQAYASSLRNGWASAEQDVTLNGGPIVTFYTFEELIDLYRD